MMLLKKTRLSGLRLISALALAAALPIFHSRADDSAVSKDKPVQEKPRPKLPADPDQAWKEIETASKPPPPPSEWANKPPTDEQKAAFYKRMGERSAEVAAMDREFYTRFPNDPRAATAKEKERRFLQQAIAFGNTDAANQDQGALTEDDTIKQKMNAVQRRAMDKRAEGMPAVLKEFESGMRAVAKEYPNRPEPWQALMAVAQNSEKEDAKRVLTDIIAAKAADEDTKARAQGMLKTMGAIGQPLQISFTALDGRKVDIQKMKGKVVLVDFWASWCGPCMAGLPEVVDIYHKYHDKGFEIVGINLDKNRQALEHTLHEYNIPWAQYFDGQGWGNKIALEYAISAIPSMWLVDKAGLLRTIEAREDLEGKVKGLLAEKL